ncbi:MAG: DEAD/DEAH box helicase [Candidatus Lokiarchaeota archaeon]|nr:DEAD/DEAH box helicase [Candidatus Lokiarchaeota archaeon]
MVDFDNFIKYIKTQDYYRNQITHIQHIPSKRAEFGVLEKPLRTRLQRWLDNKGIKLWKHQTEAINLIRRDSNIIIATSTASGKSLCYNFSVLQRIFEHPETTAIYIFPTKALARDQYNSLSSLMSDINVKETRLGIYDGDVEPNVKKQVLENVNIIITNPYGLHYYLPWFKRKWARICKNLKYIIIDEVHIYRGIFGSNFALLMRRLKRILKEFNTKPIWILSSATINNSKEFAKKLIGEEFIVVDCDKSPSGGKKVILWDLPYDSFSEKYHSAHQETKNLFITHLKKNIQTLTFTLSRKMAELQAIWTREMIPQIKEQIYSYRAGISKKKRREIENNFKNRTILGISSTNALELGIDIGSLDATISSGFPGTLSSFWQQIGRSGRGEELSISTLIPMENPLDLFYIHNPDILFGPIQEDIPITLKNKYIVQNHLSCASKENPLKENEFVLFDIENKDFYLECLEELILKNLLMKRGNKYYWKGNFYPNQKYGLNDLSDKIYKVMLQGDTEDQFLTTEDESFVFRDLHLGAVYLYEAETYVVHELDIEEKKVYIRKENVDYYTQSLKSTEITPLEVIYEKKIGLHSEIEVFFGNVKVEHEYYSYKVIDSLTQNILSRHPLEDIPIIKFESQAVWFYIPFEWQKELEMNNFDLGGTVHAIEHAMIAMAPALTQISRWDLGGVSIEFDPIKQQPVIHIYDAYRGGIGISEQLFFNIKQLFSITYRLIKTCSCKTENGCPCCCLSPRCGNQNEPLDKKGALFMLDKIINSL